MKGKKNIIGQVSILAVAVLFGLVGFLTKQVEGFVHPGTLTFYRIFFGFLFVLATIPFLEKRSFHPKKLELKHAAILSVLFVLSMGTYIGSLFFTSIQNTALLSSAAPFFVLIFAYFLLREKITGLKIVVLFFAAVGLVIINPIGDGGNIFGNILALTSALMFGIFTVLMRKFERHRDLKILLWQFFFATLLLSPTLFIWGLGDLAVIWPQILVIGFACTGLAYILLTLGLEYIESESASIILMITVPVVSIVGGYFIVHEAMDWRVIIGGSVLVLTGILFEIFSKKTKDS